ncbi:MAG TPA: amino acid adenylation domain-containing protein [Thermoanaerobaculia bacterium]|nr:amino acid adenylation domain-containing protein [Thermoanaerobaculia bacterium]
MACDPDRALSRLALLSAAERHQVLVEWNATESFLGEPGCVHELFQTQAQRTPDAIAVVSGDLVVTYGELHRRTLQLAGSLRRRGVGPGDLVGLATERSVEMVVGILGILAAGAAYVPLDPSYPRERLAFMLEDTQVSVLLTQERLVARLPTDKVESVFLDAGWEEIGREGALETLTSALQENLAYVIYTSGSTGRPKGVMISHRGLAAYLEWAVGTYVAAGDGGSLLHTSISFDLTVTSLFVPLLSGQRVVLAAEEEGVEALAAGLAEEEGLGFVKLTPSHARLLREQVAPEALAGSSRRLIVGGEALSGADLALWRESAPETWIFNEYGPTEAVVGCCVHAARAGDLESGAVPIGRPISHARLYLLAGDLSPVPQGVPGELYIGGVALARGYLGLPGLTAERFLPDPFAAQPGSRCYRTGDLARWHGRSGLEYLGRIDHQVKVRGFRIELEEIETLLAAQPGVCAAVVLAREDSPGDQRLAAYLVPEPGAEAPSEEELFASLRRELPEYMIPVVFVVLERMPLTPNGKLDRRALPAPVRRRETGARVIPRDELELQLARIWEDLLGLQTVGVEEDFFSLGGHSLLGVRLMSRIEHLLGVRLPISLLFQASTIERLAAALRHRRHEEVASSLVLIQPGSTEPPFFCIHPAHGNVLCYIELARRLRTEQPFYGLQAHGIVGESTPSDTIEDMAGVYLREIRAVQPEGPYFLGGWSMGGVVAFETARQLEAQGERIALLALFDSHAPSRERERAGIEEGALMLGFARDLGFDLSGLDLDALLGQVQGLAPAERLSRILEAAKEARLLPPDVDLAHFAQLFQIFRGNVQAMLKYRPKPFGGRVTLFQAASRAAGASRSSKLGWGRWARGGMDIVKVPGDHHSIVRVPDVETLAEQLDSRIETHLRSAKS